ASPNWTRACVVPAGFLVPAGGLSRINLTAIAAMVEKRWERSSLSGRITIVGIDISLNREGDETVGWQLHLYVLIEAENSLPLQDADSDEAGHAFQYEAGHLFRSEAGRGSDLMSATARRRCGSWE